VSKCPQCSSEKFVEKKKRDLKKEVYVCKSPACKEFEFEKETPFGKAVKWAGIINDALKPISGSGN